MADGEAIRIALADKLRSVGIRADGFELDQINPPCAHIVEDEPHIDYDLTLARGADELHFKAILYVGRKALRSAIKALDGYRSGSGTASVKTALETVDGSEPWDFVTVQTASAAKEFALGEQQFLGCEFTIEVVA